MNRIERLAAILLLLQEKPYTSDEIARHFEVSRRTVLRDVQALSEMGVPVIAQGGPGGGYSLPDNYQTAPLPLTGSEAFLLLLALSALERLSDLPFRQERATLRAKLQSVLPPEEASGARRLLANVTLDVPDRQARAPFLDALLEAAQQERWVRTVYQSSQRTSTQHLLPRQIYAQEGFWYCRAYARERGEERTYRIDRFESVGPPAEGFVPGPINPSLPYDHSSHPEIVAYLTARGRALIEADRYLSAYLQTEPDGSSRLALRCPPSELDYFARHFAALGAEITVTAPAELVERLVSLGRQLLERYEKSVT